MIGTGRIGKSFIKKAVGFDMDVLCHDPAYQDQKFVEAMRRVMQVRHEEGLATRLQTIDYVPFEEALGRADFVTLHVDLTRPGEAAEPTFHLMDERRLRMMKPTAYLVNTSRGPVVDEKALAQRAPRRLDRRRRPRRLREGAAARGQPAARRGAEAEAAGVPPLRLRGPGHAPLAGSRTSAWPAAPCRR